MVKNVPPTEVLPAISTLPDTDTAPSKIAVPAIVTVLPTYKVPPMVALLTDILPEISALIPVILEPSP